MSKKIFMIAVTDKENSLNRKYTESILEFLKRASEFKYDYIIDIHYQLPVQSLHKSINKALTDANHYEGFIVLLDCLEKETYNPNVMFELGAIFYLNKPFVVLSSPREETFPFDINDLNIISIPNEIIQYIKDYPEENTYEHFFKRPTVENERAVVQEFLYKIYAQYNASLEDQYSRETGSTNASIENILQGINDIKAMVSNTAEYIDGEKNAFKALTDAVRHAKNSLRTTRFANESIVKEDTIDSKLDFMDSLYDVSKNLKGNFHRIICNNHPAKWKDIYNILFFGGNGLKVYIRKNDFSIHFEIVVIDKKVAFIHFYQPDRGEAKVGFNQDEEKINSTLKIQGDSICQKLANVFDRLHHRDFLEESPKNPSRTLLGIPTQDNDLEEKYANFGYFMVDNEIPEYYDSSENSKRRSYIIKEFKDAFVNWRIEDPDDKVNMVAGIALIEGTDRFIEEMKNNYRLDNKEFRNAKEQYEKYRNN